MIKRYLLSFGEVSNYLGYSALKDYFPKYTMKPNPSCDNRYCVESQKAYAQYLIDNPPVEAVDITPKKDIVHEDNEWGICVVSSSDETASTSTESNNSSSNNSNSGGGSYGGEKLPEGTKFWIEKNETEIAEEDKVKVSQEDDLSSLMSQLAALKQ